MTNDADRSLIQRIASGDEDAFAMLYGSYERRLFGFLLRLVDDPATAEELVNDVMVEVWRGAARFGGRSRVSTWIFGIAHHKAVDVLRRRRLDLAGEPEPQVIDPGEPADAAVSREDLAERVASGLAALSPAHREVLELTLTEGFSVDEIAAIVGIPAGTVKTRMFHARRALRAHLTDRGLTAESV